MPKRNASVALGKARAGKKMKPATRRVYKSSVEKKFFDTTVSNQAIATTGTVIMPSLNLLTAGTGESQLVGRKCTIKSIYVRGQVNRAAVSNAALASVNSDDFIRLVLIHDTQSNGAAPTIAQVFEQADAQGMNNLENSGRFRVLKEWQVNMTDTVNHDGTNYFTGPLSKILDPVYQTKEIPLEFGATPSGVIGDLKSNNLALLGFSRTGNPTVSLRTRIRYTD